MNEQMIGQRKTSKTSRRLLETPDDRIPGNQLDYVKYHSGLLRDLSMASAFKSVQERLFIDLLST